MSEMATALGMLSKKFSTAVQQVNYPIHKGQPNPFHGKYYLVGSIPLACYDEATQQSYFYETEEAAILAAVEAGAELVQDTHCRVVPPIR